MRETREQGAEERGERREERKVDRGEGKNMMDGREEREGMQQGRKVEKERDWRNERKKKTAGEKIQT